MDSDPRDHAKARAGTGIALAAVAASALAAQAWAVLRLEVRVLVEAPSGEVPAVHLILDGGRAVPLHLGLGRTLNRLVLTRVAPAGAASPVEVLRATTAHRGIVDLGKGEPPGGAWTRSERGGWSTNRSGGRLAWSGYTSDLDLTLRQAPGAGTVEIDWNGARQRMSLDGPPAERTVRLPSARRVLYALVPPWTRQLRVSAEGDLLAPELSVRFGEAVLLRSEGQAKAREMEADLPIGLRLEALRLALERGAAFMARALWLLLAWFLAGLALTARLLPRIEPLERWVIPVATGFCSLGLVATSIAYAVPVRVAVPVALALHAIAGASLQWRASGVGRGLREAASSLRGESLLVAAAVLSTGFFLMPVLVEGDWYLGHAYTDAYYYTGSAERFLRFRMFDVWPHSVMSRYSDIVSLAAASMLLRTGAREAYAPMAGALWMTLPFAGAALLRRLGAPAEESRVGAFMVGCGAMAFAVFTQCYLAQYVFLFALLWATLFTALCLRSASLVPEPAARWLLWIAAAAVTAYCVSIYAFQFALPVGWAFAALLDREARRERARALFAVGLLAIALANVNLSVVATFPAVSRYFGNALNEIGKYTVFPFYRKPLFLSVAYGLHDFVLASRQAKAALSEILGFAAGGGPGSFPRIYRDASIGLALAGLALTFVGLGRCFRERRPEQVAAATSLLVMGGAAALLFARGEVYAYAKLLMTIGPLLLLFAAFALALLLHEAPRWRPALGALAVLLLAANLAAGFFESVDAYLPRRSEVLYAIRTHVRAIDEVRELGRFLDRERFRLGAPIALERVGRFTDAEGSDDDRVFYARVDELALRAGDGAAAGPCARYRLVMRGADSGPRGGERLELSTGLFEVYAPGGTCP